MLAKRIKETAGDTKSPVMAGGFAVNNDPALAAKPVIISFAERRDGVNPQETMLHQSCREFGEELRFETIPATSSVSLRHFKSAFIKFKLVTLGRPVIWLDPQTRLSGPIHLPEGKWDIATTVTSPTGPQLTVFRPTISALRLIELWERLGSETTPASRPDGDLFNYAKKALHGRFVETEFTIPLKS